MSGLKCRVETAKCTLARRARAVVRAGAAVCCVAFALSACRSPFAPDGRRGARSMPTASVPSRGEAVVLAQALGDATDRIVRRIRDERVRVALQAPLEELALALLHGDITVARAALDESRDVTKHCRAPVDDSQAFAAELSAIDLTLDVVDALINPQRSLDKR